MTSEWNVHSLQGYFISTKAPVTWLDINSIDGIGGGSVTCRPLVIMNKDDKQTAFISAGMQERMFLLSHWLKFQPSPCPAWPAACCSPGVCVERQHNPNALPLLSSHSLTRMAEVTFSVEFAHLAAVANGEGHASLAALSARDLERTVVRQRPQSWLIQWHSSEGDRSLQAHMGWKRQEVMARWEKATFLLKACMAWCMSLISDLNHSWITNCFELRIKKLLSIGFHPLLHTPCQFNKSLSVYFSVIVKTIIQPQKSKQIMS